MTRFSTWIRDSTLNASQQANIRVGFDKKKRDLFSWSHFCYAHQVQLCRFTDFHAFVQFKEVFSAHFKVEAEWEFQSKLHQPLECMEEGKMSNFMVSTWSGGGLPPRSRYIPSHNLFSLKEYCTTSVMELCAISKWT